MSNPLSRLLFDPVDAEGDRVPARFRLPSDQRWWAVPLGLGAALVLAGMAFLMFGGDVQRALFAYLIGWTFCLSIAIGALFFVMIQHITRARWSTTIRRIPEALAASFPLLALAGIPVLLGTYDLYHWSHADLYDPLDSHYDKIIAGKAAYFFIPGVESSYGGVPWFFYARYVVYFTAFSVLARKLYTLSVRNDSAPDPQNTISLRKWSAGGILVGAVLTSFAGYDYLMSVEPHWFSTMFGVYFFAGGWLGALCLITFMALLLKKAGALADVTAEHLQDMGKFMFAFVVFWTYIAFSQYMLYWYANLPEEIVWFTKRFMEGWGVVAWSLLIFHFILPFLILLPRITKRIPAGLAIMAVWLLVMHWVDLWWIAMPGMYVSEGGYAALQAGGGDLLASTAVMSAEAARDAVAGMNVHVVPPALPLAEMAVGLGMALLFVGATFLRLGRHAITPYGDPYFADSLRFENV